MSTELWLRSVWRKVESPEPNVWVTEYIEERWVPRGLMDDDEFIYTPPKPWSSEG